MAPRTPPDFERTTADLLVECLEQEGVKYIFGIPGEENLDLMNAIEKSSIQFITTRHEQGAAFMADVYGRLTGKTGVCLSTLGPVSYTHLDVYKRQVYLFTPLYISNYCENYCIYCGFNCHNKIRRARLDEAQIEKELKAIAATGLEEMCIRDSSQRRENISS